ncbi:MAG: fluoride efflux transporter CrcB [Planctomycetota bacterium]
MNALWIALGGGLGAVARYGLHQFAQARIAHDFPVGILLCNALGCLAIGVLGTLFTEPLPVREELRLALLVGLLGGFTTFSTFGWETIALVQAGQLRLAVSYVLASNVLGLFGVWLGRRGVEHWFGMA